MGAGAASRGEGSGASQDLAPAHGDGRASGLSCALHLGRGSLGIYLVKSFSSSSFLLLGQMFSNFFFFLKPKNSFYQMTSYVKVPYGKSLNIIEVLGDQGPSHLPS